MATAQARPPATQWERRRDGDGGEGNGEEGKRERKLRSMGSMGGGCSLMRGEKREEGGGDKIEMR